jgi:uncharacterized protein (TIGR00251 family)
MKPAADADFLTISVRVTPKASRSEIVDFVNKVLKVRLAAPPVDGAANAELLKVLAKSLGVRRSDIEIVSGAASRNKIVRIAGLTNDDFLFCVDRLRK